jgi:putative DNA methylase
LPNEADLEATRQATRELERQRQAHVGILSLVPDEATPSNEGHRAVASIAIYGLDKWADIFTARQALLLVTLARLVKATGEPDKIEQDQSFVTALQSVLACAMDREAEHSSSLCRWNSSGQKIQATFGRQAIPMLWDYAETNPFGGSVGSWDSMMECVLIPFESALSLPWAGQSDRASAMHSPLPDDAANGFITDPPYYDSVPYADLADYFYVWLKRTLADRYQALFREDLTPKLEQAIVWHPTSAAEKQQYVFKMGEALNEGRRVLNPRGIGVVVFAHKSTSGWEAQLQAMVDAGWIVTASWPIDTELDFGKKSFNMNLL